MDRLPGAPSPTHTVPKMVTVIASGHHPPPRACWLLFCHRAARLARCSYHSALLTELQLAPTRRRGRLKTSPSRTLFCRTAQAESDGWRAPLVLLDLRYTLHVQRIIRFLPRYSSRHHLISERRHRRQHSLIRQLMLVRMRNQRGELRDQFVRGEHERLRAISRCREWKLSQGPRDHAVGANLMAIETNRRARDRSAQLLQPITLPFWGTTLSRELRARAPSRRPARGFALRDD